MKATSSKAGHGVAGLGPSWRGKARRGPAGPGWARNGNSSRKGKLNFMVNKIVLHADVKRLETELFMQLTEEEARSILSQYEQCRLLERLREIRGGAENPRTTDEMERRLRRDRLMDRMRDLIMEHMRLEFHANSSST